MRTSFAFRLSYSRIVARGSGVKVAPRQRVLIAALGMAFIVPCGRLCALFNPYKPFKSP